MPSLKLILAARANGARSRGPATPEGKRRSSQNAITHGLLSRSVVMENESRSAFDELARQHVDRFQPADAVELGLIEEMATARWRMGRVCAMETRLLENSVAAQPEGDELTRMAAAFAELAKHPGLALMHRYETRLHCIYQRAFQNLLVLRNTVPVDPTITLDMPDIPNEPNPISEHPAELSPPDEPG
jgi:hypothetical protein